MKAIAVEVHYNAYNRCHAMTLLLLVLYQMPCYDTARTGIILDAMLLLLLVLY